MDQTGYKKKEVTHKANVYGNQFVWKKFCNLQQLLKVYFFILSIAATSHRDFIYKFKSHIYYKEKNTKRKTVTWLVHSDVWNESRLANQFQQK